MNQSIIKPEKYIPFLYRIHTENDHFYKIHKETNFSKYYIRWTTTDGYSGCGNPLSYTTAKAWIDYAKQNYPTIKHELVEDTTIG